MTFLLDENVSLGLAHALREQGHEVSAIGETDQRSLADKDVWNLARESSSILITRDHHFTNPTRFDPALIGGILFVRPGNLTSKEEINLVLTFLSGHSFKHYHGKLVTLSRVGARMR
ncbi:MAG: DUF5615 family PIN-like protein [Terriglobia bacterium]